MAQIVVEDLVKTFQIAERSTGFRGALKGLLQRQYRTVNALAGIDFSVQSGELVGYIGPNGAGKSTTIKILSGILVPDSGRCEISGLTPWIQRQQHVRRIGVVFGQRTQLWWDLPVIESFDLMRDIYRIPESGYKTSRDELIAIMAIEPILNVPVRQLSLGQRMRCDLVASLLHLPDILFLDEPTIGLDALSKVAIRDFIRRLNHERGMTVILTTHDMDDIEALCNRIIVIGQGQILSDGSLQDLRLRINSERRLKIEFVEGQSSVDEFVDQDARIISREANVLHLGFDPETVSSPELIARISAHYEVKDLLLENPPIEELIAELYDSTAPAARQVAIDHD